MQKKDEIVRESTSKVRKKREEKKKENEGGPSRGGSIKPTRETADGQ